jgi:gamma-glutamyl AIG2-like cyclotransferase
MNTYFAYGANMDPARLAHRLGEADPTAFRRRAGLLEGYALVFDKLSSTDLEVGYGHVVPAPGHRVEGVLNDLTDQQLARLDEIELVPRHYTRCPLGVVERHSRQVIVAQVYLATQAWLRPALKPLKSYIDALLQGSDMLSAEYVAFLKDLPCKN